MEDKDVKRIDDNLEMIVDNINKLAVRIDKLETHYHEGEVVSEFGTGKDVRDTIIRLEKHIDGLVAKWSCDDVYGRSKKPKQEEPGDVEHFSANISWCSKDKKSAGSLSFDNIKECIKTLNKILEA